MRFSIRYLALVTGILGAILGFFEALMLFAFSDIGGSKLAFPGMALIVMSVVGWIGAALALVNTRLGAVLLLTSAVGVVTVGSYLGGPFGAFYNFSHLLAGAIFGLFLVGIAVVFLLLVAAILAFVSGKKPAARPEP